MITEQEKKFIAFWEANRIRQQRLSYQLLFGIPWGLALGTGVVLIFSSGWYERANMVAHTQSSPLVLIVAILIIAVICGWLYKKFQWEQREQFYLELKAKNKTDAAKGDKIQSINQ